MPCVRWTTEQDRKLLKLADEGVSERRIAIKLGRSLNGIRIRFERLVGRRSMTNETFALDEVRPISQRLAKRALEKLDGHPPQEKTKRGKTEKKAAPPSAFAKWTLEDDSKLKEMAMRKDHLRFMARELGRTERAIYFRMHLILQPRDWPRTQLHTAQVHWLRRCREDELLKQFRMDSNGNWGINRLDASVVVKDLARAARLRILH
jgi:hypothetical protein